MSDDYYDKKVQIIPPGTHLPAVRSHNTYPADTDYDTPDRVNPGGPISGRMTQWAAKRNAKTYGSLADETSAEQGLVEADTQFRKKRIEQARTWHEWNELPEILARDRIVRRVGRAEEIRELHHRCELAEIGRVTERTRNERVLTDARTELTQARQTYTTANQGLLDAEQSFAAQRAHGSRYHSLGWQQKIGTRELEVEEQQAVLSEHRKRIAARPELAVSNEEALLTERDQRNADGLDTADLDGRIAEPVRRARTK